MALRQELIRRGLHLQAESGLLSGIDLVSDDPGTRMFVSVLAAVLVLRPDPISERLGRPAALDPNQAAKTVVVFGEGAAVKALVLQYQGDSKTIRGVLDTSGARELSERLDVLPDPAAEHQSAPDTKITLDPAWPLARTDTWSEGLRPTRAGLGGWGGGRCLGVEVGVWLGWVCILLGMRFSPVARIHLMITFVLVMCGVAGGGCFGWLLGGRVLGVLAAVAAGLGAGIGSFLSRRHVAAFLRPDPTLVPGPCPCPGPGPEAGPRPGTAPVPADGPGPDFGSVAGSGDVVVGGYAEGVADAVLVSVATYQAAAFPLTAFGVSEEERAARRGVAYRVCAHEGLPQAVRVSAAAALEAVDEGADPGRAHAAVRALSLAVYDQRAAR
ncbi:hypothetical protein ACFWG6_32025 [Streptomyces erythrochromogenes]|uniref:hypothetical protein n=1 Tax=Streptomyces erythrochromogenes TaxID=285574 RepID=UPI003644C24E